MTSRPCFATPTRSAPAGRSSGFPARTARKLRSLGASLPDFLFIDYLETKRKPAAAARQRSTISWQSKKNPAKRLRSSLRLRDLGKEFCEPGKQKSAGKARMLREAALEAEGGGESAQAEPAGGDHSSRSADRAGARRQVSPLNPCAPGAYYGRADDGTEISFAIDGSGRVSQIEARAGDGGLRYEVDLPEATFQNPIIGLFYTQLAASKTELGYSPAAGIVGQCTAPDRYRVTLTDRAGERTATLSRTVLEPGQYEGSVWSDEWGRHRSNMTISFRIHPEGWVSGPTFSGRLPSPSFLQIRRQGAWIGADRCQLGFTAFRGDDDQGERRLETHATCEPGNRVGGELLLDMDRSTSFGLFYAK